MNFPPLVLIHLVQNRSSNKKLVLKIQFSWSCFSIMLPKYIFLNLIHLHRICSSVFTKSDPVRSFWLCSQTFPDFPFWVSESTWLGGHNLSKNLLIQINCACDPPLSYCYSRKTTYQQLICFPVKNEWEPLSQRTPVQIHFYVNAGVQAVHLRPVLESPWCLEDLVKHLHIIR